MKIIYLGTFKGIHTSDMYRFFGFQQAGIFVIPLDYREFLKNNSGQNLLDFITYYIVNLPTDYILINKGEVIPLQLLKAVKERHPNIKLILFYGDMKTHLEPYLRSVMREYDIVLVNSLDKAYNQKLLDNGAKKVGYWHTATDADSFQKLAVAENFSVAFFGGFYQRQFPESNARLNLIQILSNHYKEKFLLHGSGWMTKIHRLHSQPPVYREDFVKAASQAKIIIGINAFNNVHLYTSNRQFNSMACGMFITKYFSGLETMFQKEVHLDWFHENKEAIPLCEKYLNDDALRLKIFQQGRTEIIKNHTYHVRGKEFIQILESL